MGESVAVSDVCSRELYRSCKAGGVTYVVTVDARIADGAPEMDELQRVGVIALLEQGFDAVEGIDAPDSVEVEVLDAVVAVYPGGALLKVFVVAPALEFAEEAVRSLVGELLERSELLSEWTVGKREVELHPHLAEGSLDVAEWPEAPPADPAERRAHLARRPETAAPNEEELVANSARIRGQMQQRLAGHGTPSTGSPCPAGRSRPAVCGHPAGRRYGPR